jgi:hypothetical protein
MNDRQLPTDSRRGSMKYIHIKKQGLAFSPSSFKIVLIWFLQ